MIINMKTHPTKKHLLKQFEDIENTNCFSKFNYGIVSETRPDKNAPLSCELLSLQGIFSLNSAPSYSDAQTNTDTIYINTYDNDGDGTISSSEGKLVQSQVALENEIYWSYVYNDEVIDYGATRQSISNAINQLDNVKAYINDSQEIIVTGIKPNLKFNVVSNYVSVNTISRISVVKGECVFRNGMVGVLSNNITLKYSNKLLLSLSDNDDIDNMIRIIAKFDTKVDSTGVDEFNEEQTKRTLRKDLVDSITLEKNSVDEPSDDEICLGIIKVLNGNIVIDSDNTRFRYNRPWYSVWDLKHRSNIGTGKITHHNPHGIDYNDIDTSNTLHNKLTEQGMVVSPSKEVQDVSGETKITTFKATDIKLDYNGTLTNETLERSDDDIIILNKYFILPEIPICINYIIDSNGKPVDLNWRVGTSYLFLKSKDAIDITVSYIVVSTLKSSVSNKGEGVLISPVASGDIVLSEGMNVTTIQDSISFTEVGNIDKKYDAYVNKSGSIVKIPSTQYVGDLSTTSSASMNALTSRSRVEATLLNTPNDIKLDCPDNVLTIVPFTDGTITSNITNETLVYHTYCAKDYDGNELLESYTSPNSNTLEESVGTKTTTENVDNKVTISGFKRIHNYLSNPFVETYKSTELGTLGIKDVGVQYTGSSYSIQKKSKYKVYGGIKFQIGLSNIAETTENIVVVLKHNSTMVTIINTSLGNGLITQDLARPSFGVSVMINDFDGMDISGNWELLVTDSSGDVKTTTISYLEIDWFYGKVFGNIYSSIDDEIKCIAKDIDVTNESIESNSITSLLDTSIDDSKTSINTNEDFSVIVSINGTSNGTSISEKLTFDSSFRQQEGMNTQITSNVFDEVTTFYIEETSTTGNLVLLGYPVGSIGNLCGVFSVKYKNKKIIELTDIRKVGTTIRSSQVDAEENDLNIISKAPEILFFVENL